MDDTRVARCRAPFAGISRIRFQGYDLNQRREPLMPLAATEVYPPGRIGGSAAGAAVRPTVGCRRVADPTISSARPAGHEGFREPASSAQVENLQSFSNSPRAGAHPTLMETRIGRYIGASFLSVLMFHVSLD